MSENKHISLSDLVAKRRKTLSPKVIVLATGVFDILHSEHKRFLKKAKKQGDILIVGIESDLRVKKIKGKTRPVNDQTNRAKKIAALKEVDYAFILPKNLNLKTAREKLIKDLKPHIYAVSENSPHIKEKQRIMKKFGGELKVVLKHNPVISTTRLIVKKST